MKAKNSSAKKSRATRGANDAKAVNKAYANGRRLARKGK